MPLHANNFLPHTAAPLWPSVNAELFLCPTESVLHACIQMCSLTDNLHIKVSLQFTPIAVRSRVVAVTIHQNFTHVGVGVAGWAWLWIELNGTAATLTARSTIRCLGKDWLLSSPVYWLSVMLSAKRSIITFLLWQQSTLSAALGMGLKCFSTFTAKLRLETPIYYLTQSPIHTA